ncbi:probable serine/threonine-protein kinase mps1 isoform X1 [Colletes gigas]|uniref:probable serine/threonine-protein kinase mps1 isoform X1 n=1 Tax=Colletes gigas TaxID=935657 RepID=UPI001C9ADC4C|nr:probable serine/threonine-protein kinase mps1 isoform X1 [Colletes gigas]
MPEASGSGLADEADYSTFENKTGLADDMKFLARMPELCDVTFLVGDTREPVCAVKAVLAARSRVFHRMLYQAPSPQRKKEPPPRENKIRLFLKRSSEPLLNLQNTAQQRSGFTQQLAPIQEPNQHPILIVEEFEPDVFRQLIEYIHTGCVTLQPRTLLGVMNAADYYGLDELRKACSGFVQCCITVDTVCALLASAERYIQYKCTKSLVQRVLEFVDDHGNEVLNLGSFTLLPQHVVRLILVRDELRADEFTKFQAALMWSKKYCDSNQDTSLKDVIGNFLEYIQFHRIPTNMLMKEVHPLDLVPSEIIMNALAYQADPTSIDPGKISPHRVRRQGHCISVQSSLDPYGSNTTLSSTYSDAGSDQKQHSGKNGTAEQETTGEQQQRQPSAQKQQEEEDVQWQIDQRNQLQQQRSQQEQESQRQQEEQRKRLQMEEESKKQMNKEDKTAESEKTRDEEPEKQQTEEESAEQVEKKATEEQLPMEESKQEESREQAAKVEEEDAGKKEQPEEQQEKSKEVEEDSKAEQQQEDLEQQAAKAEPEKEEVQSTSQEAPKQPEEGSQQPREPEVQQEDAEERRRSREERRLRLHLEELKVHLAMQRDQVLQRQEEAVLQEIQERHTEEQLENRRLEQLQLCLEGRRPDVEKSSEEQQRHREDRKVSKRKRKKEKMKVRAQEESQKDELQEQPQEEQNVVAPVDGVSGFYIRLVVRQEGRANLVWLLKTHMF